MKTIGQLITTRRITLGLILLVAGFIYVSTLVPQEIDGTPGKIDAWRRAHPQLLWLVDAASLHRLYGQPWFAATVLLSALALGVSSCNQLGLARGRLRSGGSTTGVEIATAVPEQRLREAARTCRYLQVRSEANDQLKFVKHPWGYFGSLLLHLGMTLVIVASLYVALTGRQGALIMTEGEERSPRDPWDIADQGTFARPLELPGNIRLDRVRVRFDAKNLPEEVSSDLSVSTADGQVDTLTATINRSPAYRGLRIYHASQYGTAFTVEFTDRLGATHRERILVQQPVDLATPGYSDDFRVSWSPYLFGAKAYADTAGKSMVNGTPQLTIRMLDGTRETGRTIVPPDDTAPLGEYRLRLVEAKRWAKLIMVDNGGMPAIFTGFAIIMLGGLLHYLFPPRELIALADGEGTYRVRWKSTAFAEFFYDERELLARHLRGEKE